MWDFTCVTYNIMIPVIEPIRNNGQRRRISLLPTALYNMDKGIEKGIDVVCLQELIVPEYRSTMLKEMAMFGWKHFSNPLNTTYRSGQIKLASGGVVICSKHPILTQHQCVFETDCEAEDCAASKGVVYCRILLPDKNIVNVFSTHFQAWHSQKARNIRYQQALQTADFIKSMNIPDDEALVFCGDANIDVYTRQSEIRQLMNTIGMELTPLDDDSHPFSSDPATNTMVGNDSPGMYSTVEYPNGCYSEYIETGVCMCCPQELLDIFAYSVVHQPAYRASSRVHMIKTDEPFVMNFNIKTRKELHDLSDHYPLIGQFQWKNACPFQNRDIKCGMKPFSNRMQWIFITIVIIICVAVLLFFIIKVVEASNS